MGVQIDKTTDLVTGAGTYSDNTYALLLFWDVTNNITYAWIQGMSNNFIGVVQSTVSYGGSVSVLVSGQDGNQSGLVAGLLYQALNGTFVAVGTQAVADNIYEQFYVKAVSPTQIII